MYKTKFPKKWKWLKLSNLPVSKEKTFKNSMKKGDRVITKFGVHGKIVEVNDQNDSCVVETMAGKLKMERGFISMELSQKLTSPSKK